ncbi:MAG TPA: amidohydrolase family protein [Novosphingobium sp.]|nr:amidohydrolase family protein [Novosphingobium sp.]
MRLALTALAFALAAPAAAQDFAVINATVVIGDGSAPIERGTVVVRGGKVAAAGAAVSVPAGIETIDAAGKWVTPGIVVGVTDLGLVDVDAVGESNDYAVSGSPFNAALDVAPAVNPSAQPIAVTRAAGITRAAIAGGAGGSVFAGQGAIIDLGADPQAVTRARAFQFVELGEDGAAKAGGSRTAAHALLRNALREARDFGRREGVAGWRAERGPISTGDDVPLDPRLAPGDERRDQDVLLTRFDAAALIPVVAGRQPLYVHVERASDIRAVLGLKREFPALRLVIVGASEGWLAAADLAAAGVPVIADALNDLPSEFEQLAATQSNIGRMTAAGVKVALGNLRNDDNAQPRYAAQYAGNLVALTRVPGASGLSWGQAFAAISSVPAEILGMGERFGSLRAGRAGDVVIWDGDPLEVSSAVLAVFIDGVAQPIDNHQTRLRERYRTPSEGALPKAYDW